MGAKASRGQAMIWALVDIAARVLEPAEREVVRGDLEESGETGVRALRDVLSLVVRRQAALWSDWRPWLALIGLVPVGMWLALISRQIADHSAVPIWMYVNNWEMTHVTNSGFRVDLLQNAAAIGTQWLMLLCSSWTIGCVLGFFARRTVWANGALFCLALLVAEIFSSPRNHAPGHAAVFALPFYNTIFPWVVLTVLVLLPSVWGMRIFKEKKA